MLAPAELENPPIERATCAVVGKVSTNRAFLEPHGNYNPNFEKTSLESSKIQFQLIAPTSHPEFEIDFGHAINRIVSIQKKTIKEGPPAEHFVVTDGIKPALKFSWPIFEKRVRHHVSSALTKSYQSPTFTPIKRKIHMTV